MPSGHSERYDFFLSRRGSVAAIAQEVTDVLTEKGYRVFVQDYDIRIAANSIEEMHEAVKLTLVGNQLWPLLYPRRICPRMNGSGSRPILRLPVIISFGCSATRGP